MLPHEKWLPMSCRDLSIFMLNDFNYLINALCSSHALWLPLPGDQLVDVSTQGIGAVLGMASNALWATIINIYFQQRLTMQLLSWNVWQCSRPLTTLRFI